MGTVSARRRPRAFAAALATLAITASFAAAPAQAVDKEKYIALGDSYAAGQGAGPYLDACYRSNNAYSELADEAKSIQLVVNAACSGKTTWDVVNSQLRQLKQEHGIGDHHCWWQQHRFRRHHHLLRGCPGQPRRRTLM